MTRQSLPLTVETAPLIEVDAVEAHYGAIKVLDQISFKLYPGRTLALVGESGSGKSTMARVLAGLLHRSSGQITLEGRALPASHRQRPRDIKRQIQIIYQNADTALNPRQKIMDIIRR